MKIRVDNEISVIIKQYIYRMRCFSKSLSISALLNVIKDFYTTQKQVMNSKDNLQQEKFSNDWRKWKSLVDL